MPSLTVPISLDLKARRVGPEPPFLAQAQTPIGHSFRVYRKNKDHVSGEFKKPDGSPVGGFKRSVQRVL